MQTAIAAQRRQSLRAQERRDGLSQGDGGYGQLSNTSGTGSISSLPLPESCRRVRPHPRRDVAVRIQCGLDVIVPQALAHGLDVDACLEQERGMHVSEAVEPDRRNCGQTADPASKAPTNDGRIQAELAQGNFTGDISAVARARTVRQPVQNLSESIDRTRAGTELRYAR
jgi:hypothetical protein